MSTEIKPRRWDPVVKLTHWAIVLAIVANAIFTEAGSAAHIWIGYALAAILGLRLLWGFVGPAEARFKAFPPSPRRALTHVRDIRAARATHHHSHNPLGALMVYAIWSCLIVIISTGIAMAGVPGSGEKAESDTSVASGLSAASPATARKIKEGAEGAGRGEREVAGEEGQEGDEGDGDEDEDGPLGEVHEVAVNLLYVLILLHIAGVVFETRRSGRQVVLAMLPFRR